MQLKKRFQSYGEAVKRHEHEVAVGALLLTVAFWGYSFISTKIVLRDLPPSSVAFFRQIVALAALLAGMIASKKFPRVRLRDLLWIALSGFFGIVLYFVCENTGLQFTNASSASMIVSAVPVLTLVTEALFYKTKITRRTLACILLSIAGVYLVVSDNGTLDFASSSLWGNVLVMGAMISWVAYMMLNKKLGVRYSSTTLTFYQTLSSIVLFLPFVIPEIGRWKWPSPAALGNLLYLGIFCSALAYVLYLYAAKKLGPSVSSAFLNLTPVVTVVLGYFILGETVVWLQIAGMALILASLFILSRKPA